MAIEGNFVHFLCYLLVFGVVYYGAETNDLGCSCQIYQNCVNTYPCGPGGNCRMENIAFGKKATISSLWSGYGGPSAKACAAINGNTSRAYGNDGTNNPNCVYTAENQSPSWWKVDLRRNYTVSRITVFSYFKYESRILSTSITVDKLDCFTVLQTFEKETIHCKKPLTGQFVTFSRNGELAFCEVQIWACRPGWYGEECDHLCNCKENRTCGNFFGECSAGCADGYYGLNCSEKCGNCKENNSCNMDGICASGCRKGWQGLQCLEECDSYHYGINCNITCGHCGGNGSCDRFNGRCADGCRPGWISPTCDEKCAYGRYGQDCNMICGQCNDTAACDHISGNCTTGCLQGWTTSTCDQRVLETTSANGSIGGIVGGVIGGLVVVITMIVTLILLRRRRLAQQDKSDSVQSNAELMSDTTNYEGHKLQLPAQSHRQQSALECSGETWDEPSIYSVIHTDTKSKNNTHHVYGNVTVSSETSKSVMTTDFSTHSIKYQNQPGKKAGQNEDVYAKPNRELTLMQKHSNTPPERNKPSVPKKPDYARNSVSGVRSVDPNQLEDNENAEYEDDVNDIYNNEDIYSTYKLQKRAHQFDVLQQYLLASLSSNMLSKQFKELNKEMKYPHTQGLTAANVKKNKFKMLCPYDYNRVILRRSESDSETDYINASYIKGYTRDKAYIASQGPKRHTVDDLWLMIWQENITHVTMLTNLKEDGKDKCEMYWPKMGTTGIYGRVSVSCVKVEMRDDFIIRTFSLQFKGNSLQKHVEQYHYVAWPDHGVPSVISLVNYWRYVHNRAPTNLPLLVHCSAGVGRTGTYIALDIAMDMSAHRLDINVQKIVSGLREERYLMVQAEAQYKFLFEVILEAHTSRSTRLTSDQFNVKFQKTIDIHETSSVIDKEFEMLQQIGKFVPKPKFSMASAEENIFKNRNPDALPEDNQLAYIGVPVSGRNMYINAVFLSSFKRQRDILLTQLPLPDTLVDIWRLVDDKDVKLIVSLSSKDEDGTVENYCQYWPRVKTEEISAGPYTVKLTGSRHLGHNTTSYHLTYMRETKSKQCRVLHYTNWSGEVPDNTEDIIHLVDTINVARSENDSCPVLIQCVDGAAKSGLFCIIWENLIRLKNDLENDIYLTARKVRTVRPQAVTSQVQYRFCYKVAQDYQHNAGVYQNT